MTAAGPALGTSPDELEQIVAGTIAFLEGEVRPRHQRHRGLLSDPRALYAEDGRFSDEALALIAEVRTASAAAGYYGMCVPIEHGGGGLGVRALLAVMEAVHRWGGAELWLAHHMFAHWATGPSHLLSQLTPSVASEATPGLMSGTTSLCFAMSEPDAGSDVWMMQTTARRDGDGWRLSGTKQWITNAPYADHAFVFAVTDPEAVKQRTGGISCFFVPTDAAGFSVASVIRMFGELGGEEGVVILDDVRVEDEQLVGSIHEGLRVGLSGIATGRIYNAGRAIGLAGWAMTKTVEHLQLREAFGAPLNAHQGVTFPLAESALELHAARLVAEHAATLVDEGRRAHAEVAAAKILATEAAGRAIDRAIQTHGAAGFTNELHLSEAWTLVRKARVADGTAEILRRQIVQALVRGEFRV